MDKTGVDCDRIHGLPYKGIEEDFRLRRLVGCDTQTMAFLKRSKKAKDPFREIQDCLQRRDYKGALGGFKSLLTKDAKNTQIRLRFADTLVLAGSKNEAIRQYRKVADELAEAGFMIRAIAINKKIVQLDPTQTDVHEKLANMNEERSRSVSSRSSLPLHVGRPLDAEEMSSPIEEVRNEELPTSDGVPPVEKMPPPVETMPAATEEKIVKDEPTLSLEESMAMEFGDTAKSGAAAPVGGMETDGAPPREEEVVELDLGRVDLEEPSDFEAVGFELADDGVPPLLAGETAETDEEPSSLDAGIEEESSQVEVEPPTFELTEEEPTFEEEPVPLAGEDVREEELEVDLSVGAELKGVSRVEEEPSAPIELVSEAEEMELEAETVEGEEDEEIEVEIETEPEMAADGDNPLVGLLGDDIDSLIDSIIFDVETSVSMPLAPARPAPTRIPLFSDLNAEEFVDVAIMLVRRSERPGTVIVKEGDPGESMFIVSTGEAEATREDEGQDVKLAVFGDGDFFGEMAVLSGEPRTATVTAVKNTEFLELSRADLQQICSRHPEVEAKLRLAYDERRSQQ